MVSPGPEGGSTAPAVAARGDGPRPTVRTTDQEIVAAAASTSADSFDDSGAIFAVLTASCWPAAEAT